MTLREEIADFLSRWQLDPNRPLGEQIQSQLLAFAEWKKAQFPSGSRA